MAARVKRPHDLREGERVESGRGAIIDGQGRTVRRETRSFPFGVAPGQYGVVRFAAGWKEDYDVGSVLEIDFSIPVQIDRWERDDAGGNR